jgi:hypothetical protein
MKQMIKNKKGVIPFMVILLGVILILAFFASFSVSSSISAIHPIVWVVIGLFIIVLFLSKGGKK